MNEGHWRNAKEYTSDLAGEASDLVSIQHDLKFALRATELLLELSEQVEGNDLLGDEGVRRTSLWNAAVIAYARCFKSGVRRVRIPVELLDGLGDLAAQARKAHTYVLDLRDKYIAHSVSRFEDAKVMLLVGDSTDPHRIIGVGPLLMRPAAEASGNVKSLRSLAKVFGQYVDQELLKRNQQLEDEASRLTADQLAALPDNSFPLPIEPHEAGKRRRR